MPGIDERDMSAGVDAILNRRPAVGLAVAVVRNGSLDFFQAHGVADVASRRPVTEDTVFRVGSVTKTFTAVAVMQLWEQGLLDLDATADRYLRRYRLVPARAGLRPPTVRHLLTHTAGIGEVAHPSRMFGRLFGETVKPGRRVPTPAEFYRGRVRVYAEPGTRFVYTDHGFVTLGQIVADVSGQPLDRYLREQIFEPLGMADTDLVRSACVTSNVATGYRVGSRGARAIDDYELITAAGGGAYSTPRDLARYAAALLGGGTNRYGSVLKPATLAMMFEPQYQPDPRVPGIGLAFWLGELGGHRVVNHGGIMPGFNTEMFLAPEDGVSVLTFTNGANGATLWLPAATAGLLGQLLGVPEPTVRDDVPQHPELWGDLCGWYRLPARITDARARAMAGAGVEVFVRGGRLMLRVLSPLPVLYQGFPLHPDDRTDPYSFRLDLTRFGIGTARVVFSQEPGAGTTAVHFELLPLSARKQPAATNPRRRAGGALALAATAVAVRGARRYRAR
jgi:CubicO group peptidase (beta-lactamase class C family)